MLTAHQRLRSRADFTRIVRSGRRSKGTFVIVATLPGRAEHSRVGFTVGKSVGNAVVRHRVTRQLGAIMAELMPDLQTPTDVVLRALPAAARAAFPALRADIQRSLEALPR